MDRKILAFSILASFGIIFVSLIIISTLLSMEPSQTAYESDNIDTLYSSILNIVSENEKYYGIGGTEHNVPEFLVTKYNIKEGDTLIGIAKKTGISIDTIVSINKPETPNLISPGTTLLIPNRNGIMHTIEGNETTKDIASKYGVDKEKIEAINKLSENILPQSSSELFIPGVRFSADERADRLGLLFNPPMARFRITSRYGYRKDPFTKKVSIHKGIDLAHSHGAAVYASKGGVVIFTGIKRGYGKTVVVQHQGGYTTLYAHLSKIRTKNGRRVARGTLIGNVGSTGRSTGPHLHFEVRLKGKTIDPTSVSSFSR